MIDDDGTGTTGTILNNAWLQTIYGQIDTLVGPHTIIPDNQADLIGWTGGNYTYGVSRIGTLLFWQFITLEGNVPASTANLSIKLPTGVTSTRTYGQPFSYFANGAVFGTGYAAIDPDALDRVRLYRDLSATPWPAGGVYISAACWWVVG